MQRSDRDFSLETLKNCVRCGLCQSECPVYKIDRVEGSSPRGRLHIIENIEEKAVLNSILSNCLLCHSCTRACPNGVHIPDIIRSVRRDRGLQSQSYYLSRLVQGVDFEKLGILSSLLDIDRRIGGILRLALKKRALPAKGREKIAYQNDLKNESIAIFTGCISTIFYGEVVNRLAGLLRDKGYNVYIPESQVCCGLMNYSAGDDGKAERLVKINMELFSSSKIKKIITLCSSCAFMLGRYESIVSGGEAVSEKVYTITDLILEQIETILVERPGVLHIPCHIRNSKENYIYERLKRLKDKNVRIIDRCCGYGGVFNLYNYEKSIRIGEGLLKDIEGFDRVYTLCSGCFLQIYDIIQRNNMDVYVCSIFELL